MEMPIRYPDISYGLGKEIMKSTPLAGIALAATKSDIDNYRVLLKVGMPFLELQRSPAWRGFLCLE